MPSEKFPISSSHLMVALLCFVNEEFNKSDGYIGCVISMTGPSVVKTNPVVDYIFVRPQIWQDIPNKSVFRTALAASLAEFYKVNSGVAVTFVARFIKPHCVCLSIVYPEGTKVSEKNTNRVAMDEIAKHLPGPTRTPKR